MLRYLYTVLFLLALPVIFFRLWKKDKKVPGYKIRWPERFGIYTPREQSLPVVWVHAVSVGEVVAATPLIQQLLTLGHISLMVTTMTPTGSTRVQANFGGRVLHVYAPYDLPWTVRAFLKRTQPVLVIIMETELWPNILQECKQQGLPVILANARLSARSAARYAWFKATIKEVFNCVTQVAVQNADDGQRFIELGLSPEKLTVTGSIKFDFSVPENVRDAARHLRLSLGMDRPIWIAASTHEGEDTQILTAFKQVLMKHPNCLLILVPRHPERFLAMYELCSPEFSTCRRSLNQVPHASTQIYLGDSMGELMTLYGVADIAFVGGSLIERGGHNVIEPASLGIPVICGPHTFNFEDIVQRLEQAEGLIKVNNAETLGKAVITWLDQPQQRRQAGDNAVKFTQQNRGALKKMMTLVRQALSSNPN